MTVDEILPGDVPCTVGTNLHGRYCVPLALRHRPVARTILSGEVWRPRVLDLVAAHRRCDVVHAGALFGAHLPALSRSRALGSLVWAFEPSAEHHRCARSTVSMNELRNVRSFHAALGERRAPSELSEVWTIDETVPPDREVGVILLDVKGSEGPALRGARRTIARCRPVLVLESQSALLADGWFHEHIYGTGYERIGTIDENVVLSPPLPV